LTAASAQVEASLDPEWREEQIVSAQGTVLMHPVLSVGPVEVAFDLASGSGGLVSRAVASEPRVLDIFTANDLHELRSLTTDKAGYISIDPTLGNALRLNENRDSLLTHLEKGGVWAVPIVFFGLLAFTIAAFKSWQLLRLPKVDTSLTDRLQRLLVEQRQKGATTTNELKQKLQAIAHDAGAAQRKMMTIALSSPVSQQRDDLLVAYLMEYKHQLERYMGVVATTAAIAPLLGLLGTVSGMISTFQMMTIFGSGDASTVSGGISEALITTELGLIVAIPSLLVSALLTRKAKSYSHQLENFAIKLSKIEFSN
jgi:biopolymer transport protein ExbB